MRPSTLFLLWLSPLGIAAQNQRVSTDATCGGSNGYTCIGSAWGNCCSQYGWCGRVSRYCGAGCNPSFGTCNGQSASSSTVARVSISTRSSSAASSATQAVSKNARCGPSFNRQTCLGSGYGDCCSQYSYCGSTNVYCAADKCQQGFGRCNTMSSSSSLRQSSTSSSVSSSVSPRVSSSSSTASSVSSSTPPSSTIAVMSTSASLSASPAPKCVNAPTCQAYTGPVTGSCPSSDGMCQGGYQAKCGQVPGSESTVLFGVQTQASASESCATACTGSAGCVAFGITDLGNSRISCALYSKIGELTTGPFGSATYLKTCNAGSISSSSITASSSTSEAQSSASSLSSSTLIASSSSITSSASTSTASASPADPSCISVSNCEPFTGPLTESCQASSNKCQSGYQVKCSQVPQLGSVRISRTETAAGQGDACAAACTGNAACVGFVYGPEFDGKYYCNLWSKISSVSTGFGSTHLKVCPDSISSSPVGVSSLSSSAAQSSASSTASSIATSFAISTTVSSSSIISSSATPSTIPSASPFSCEPVPNCTPFTGSFSTACANGNDKKCNSGFQVLCSTSFLGTNVDSLGPVDSIDEDACVLACQGRADCTAAFFKSSNKDFGALPCYLLQRKPTVGSILPPVGASYVVSFVRVCS